MLRYSDDGGKTWSARITAEAETPNSSDVHSAIGVQPLVLSNGNLVVVYDDVQAGAYSYTGTMKSIVSTDGGLTWSSPVPAFALVPHFEELDGVRAPNLPSATTDGSNIWVAFHDSTFSGGTTNDILIMRSSNEGGTWSLPFDASPNETTVDHFTAGLGTANGNLYLTYRAKPAGMNANTTTVYVDAVFRKIMGGTTVGAPVSLYGTLTNLDQAAITTVAAIPFKFMGDYAAIAVSSTTATPIWCQAQNFANQTPNSTNTHIRAFSSGLPT